MKYSKIINSRRRVKGANLPLPLPVPLCCNLGLIHISGQCEAKNCFDVASKFHTFAPDKSPETHCAVMMNCNWGRGREGGERGWRERGVTGQHSPNICHVCCLCMRHRLHIIKKSVKWPCEESKLCHSTGKLNQNQESQNHLTPFPPSLHHPLPQRAVQISIQAALLP